MTRNFVLDEHIFPPFHGFPRKGIDFLRKLKKNNKRDWFLKHKSEYEELTKFPMQCLIESLRQRMADTAPEIEFNPKRSIFRIHRDVRFSKNKAPYKTNIAASFHIKSKKGPTESPGLYLHIEPGEVFIGGGLYMPTGVQLKAIRKSISSSPDAFLDVIQNRKFRKQFRGLQGEKLQKAPLGFPRDHPMIEYLRHKQFFVYKTFDESACYRAGFASKVAAVFTDIIPLIRWLSTTAL